MSRSLSALLIICISVIIIVIPIILILNATFNEVSNAYENQDQIIEKISEIDNLIPGINLTANVVVSDLEDGDVSYNLEIISSDVDVNEVGVYSLTYRATDNSNLGVTKKINVYVKAMDNPIITVSSKTVSQFTDVNLLDYATAVDVNGTPVLLTVSGVINPDVIGKYDITYQAVDSQERTSTYQTTFTVIVNAKPIINATDKTYNINDTVVLLNGVSANDTEDGSVEVKVVINNIDIIKKTKYILIILIILFIILLLYIL
jgi:hypothetical protein